MKYREGLVRLIIGINLRLMGMFNPLLAEKARRMIFISSLANALQREQIITKKYTRNELNLDLRLSENSESLIAGELLTNVVWDMNAIKTKFASIPKDKSDKQMDTICNELIDCAPSWVSYGHSRMRYDVQELLTSFA